jgi:hypothetical protein
MGDEDMDELGRAHGLIEDVPAWRPAFAKPT